MTAYETVFSAFRDKITAYTFLDLTDVEEHEVLLGYMNNAIAKFGRICKKMLNRNNEISKFEDDLTDEEIDILTELMVESWVKPKLYNEDLLKNSMSTKDYTVFSPANLLNQLRELNKDTKNNARAMMNQYSVLNSNYGEMS